MTLKPAEKSLTSLYILIFVFAAPIFGAVFLVIFPEYLPSNTANKGSLIAQVNFPETPFTLLNGDVFPVQTLRNRWVIVTFLGAQCDPACEQKLFYLRQIRKAMANNRQFVERVVVLTDTAIESSLTPAILQAADGAIILKHQDATDQLIKSLGETALSIDKKVYLMDARGILMMRYASEQPAEDTVQDLERLFKAFPINN